MTDAERKLLRLLTDGKTQQEAADELGVHRETVKARLRKLRRVAGVPRTVQLVAWAARRLGR